MDIVISTNTYKELLLKNVNSFYINECELSITFNENHGYNSIEEIDSLLNIVGISVNAYHFNHIDCYGNHSSYGTDVLCILPKLIRGNLHIQIIR